MRGTPQNNWQPFFDDIRKALVAAWPEVGPNYRTVRSQRENWAQGLQFGTLTIPYVIMQISPARQSEEWSALDSIVYEVPVQLFYITYDDSDARSNPKGLDFDDWLDDRMFVMQQQLVNMDDVFVSCRVIEEFATDQSETNQVNLELAEADMPLWSCALSFSAITGVNINV